MDEPYLLIVCQPPYQVGTIGMVLLAVYRPSICDEIGMFGRIVDCLCSHAQIGEDWLFNQKYLD